MGNQTITASTKETTGSVIRILIATLTDLERNPPENIVAVISGRLRRDEVGPGMRYCGQSIAIDIDGGHEWTAQLNAKDE